MPVQSTVSENELLQASLAGSKEAFGTIVQRYQSLVCAITYTATGDMGKSEELAQETFIRAWKSLRQLKDLSRFRNWLCTIARNLVSKSTQKGRADVIGSALPIGKAGALAATAPGPSDAAISKEQQAVVWRALQNIHPKYREPMVLFYREQQSVSQVAAGLELSEQVVRQRLSRGRKLLKAEAALVVGDVLGRTGPGKVFTVAVVAALPAVSVEAAAAAVAGATAKSAPAAKAVLASALSGAILGPIIGLLGGVFGSWMSVKHTNSPRERQFMLKITLVIWTELIVLLSVLGLFLVLARRGIVPKNVYWTVFAVVMTTHFVLLVPAIIWVNRRQRQIQKEEGTYVEPRYQLAKITTGGIVGAFAGSIFGTVAWIFPMSYIAGDWLVAAAVSIFAVLLFAVSTRICLRANAKYWRIIIADLIAVGLLNLIVVNLRWETWMEFYRQSSAHSRSWDMPVWAANLMFGLIFGGLLVIFVLKSRKQKFLTDEEPEGELRQ
jgi:RNA polymerase sigma factor (sigma-70 family)